MDRLPPLNGLKAFAAAARHLSFTAAAVELHVTHGAVSRQVAALEAHLGTALFIRGARALALTESGARLARAAGAAFDILRAAAAEVGRSRAAAALRISVPPTLAMRWLIPRMGALHQAHPDLRIELSTSIEPADFGGDPYDAAIRRVGRVTTGLRAERFLDARAVPVCSPKYKKQFHLRGPADLARATLVYTRSEPQAWNTWLRRHAVPGSENVLTFDQLYFALQAALDSLGVALAPAELVANEIQRGRLCALATPQGAAPIAYALLWPRASANQAAIATLGQWLRAAAAQGPI